MSGVKRFLVWTNSNSDDFTNIQPTAWMLWDVMAWVTSSFWFYTRPCSGVLQLFVDPFGKEGQFLRNFIFHVRFFLGGVGSNHYWIFFSCLPHDSNPPEFSLWDKSPRDSRHLTPLSNESCSAPISLPFFVRFPPDFELIKRSVIR